MSFECPPGGGARPPEQPLRAAAQGGSWEEDHEEDDIGSNGMGGSTQAQLVDCLRRVREAEETLGQARCVLTTLVHKGGEANPVSSKLPQARSREQEPGRGRDSSEGSETPPEVINFALRLGISAAAARKCHAAFCKVDEDGLGVVSLEKLWELLDAVSRAPLSDQQHAKILREVHSNNDGSWGIEEFLLAFGVENSQKASQINGQTNNQSSVGMELVPAMPVIDDDNSTPGASSSQRKEERKERVGVPKKMVTAWLQKELAEAGACLQLPWALALFFFFFMAVHEHLQIETLHAMDMAISNDLLENANFAFSGIPPLENGRMGHKNINDVNSFADFWSWFDMGIAPLFWMEGWDVSEVRLNTAYECMGNRDAFHLWGGFNDSRVDSLTNTSRLGSQYGECPDDQSKVPEPPADFFGVPYTPTYLYYHSVVGGVRMRQERPKDIDCPADGDLDLERTVHTGRCVPDPGYWLEPEIHTALHTDESTIDQAGGETVYLLSGWTQRTVRSKLRELEDQVWIGPHTAKAEILFTTYNAHVDVLTATFILFFVNRGGHIHKLIEPVSIWVHPYHSWLNYVLDFSWTGLLLKIFFEEVKEIGSHVRQLGFRRGLSVYFNVWNLVDWVSALYGVVIVVNWCIHLKMVRELRADLLTANVEIQGSWESEETRIHFFDLVERIVKHVQAFRQILALYPFAIVLRFFKAFASQPRLAVVTKTFTRAGTDILHFAVVFGSIFVVYTSAAMILFGQELLDFANFGRSCNSVFRVLLGDFDWELMNRIGRPQAGIWFWSFMWIVNFIMLNMLLAIVMDVYTDVKGGIGSHAETLFSQSVEIFDRWRSTRNGTWVPLSDVLEALDPQCFLLESSDAAEDETALGIAEMMRICPALQRDQAHKILVWSAEWWEMDCRPSESLTDATLRISDIDTNCATAVRMLERLLEGQKTPFGQAPCKHLLDDDSHGDRERDHAVKITIDSDEGLTKSGLRARIDRLGEALLRQHSQIDATTAIQPVLDMEAPSPMSRPLSPPKPVPPPREADPPALIPVEEEPAAPSKPPKSASVPGPPRGEPAGTWGRPQRPTSAPAREDAWALQRGNGQVQPRDESGVAFSLHRVPSLSRDDAHDTVHRGGPPGLSREQGGATWNLPHSLHSG
mmetsp:Transcript_129847/g.289680  ORF Transcript_129847/g.289680 Transcript_129847/m.289680 type:complete len:1143 (+) Transcript_129847:49-3477(+)